MPFCRECGKEVQEDWITCPYCSASQNSDSMGANIQDSVISGDLSVESTVNINTRSKREEIENLAELMLVKLSSNDMAAAKEAYTEAKKIDVKMAQDVFENDYSLKIGAHFADIVEHYMVQISLISVTATQEYFGHGITTWNVEGHHQISHLLSQQDIAIENAISFLGSSEMEDAKSTIYQETWKQKYRLSLLRIATGGAILNKTLCYYYVDGINQKFLEQCRESAMVSYFLGIAIRETVEKDDALKESLTQWVVEFSDIQEIAESSSNWEEQNKSVKEEIEGNRKKAQEEIKRVNSQGQGIIWLFVFAFIFAMLAGGGNV